MRLGHYARLAVRESRRSRGRIGLFVACIAVGVAAVVVVAGLSKGVNDGVRAEGRRLLAADVSVEGRRPLPDELNGVLTRFATERFGAGASIGRADVREFVSVILGGANASVLA